MRHLGTKEFQQLLIIFTNGAIPPALLLIQVPRPEIPRHVREAQGSLVSVY